jgi:hypothetical protein
MKCPAYLALLLLAFCLPALAQDPAIAPLRPLPATPAQQQDNAASANQDTSGTSGDQLTKPAAAKGSTLIGCLAGPDKDGKFMLRNMTHRSGVQVVGPNDLKNDSGSKVKLTGQWQPLPQSQEPVACRNRGTRRPSRRIASRPPTSKCWLRSARPRPRQLPSARTSRRSPQPTTPPPPTIPNSVARSNPSRMLLSLSSRPRASARVEGPAFRSPCPKTPSSNPAGSSPARY